MPAICPNCEVQFKYNWCHDGFMMYALGKELGYCETVEDLVIIGEEEVSLVHYLCECGLIISTSQESASIGLICMTIDVWKDIDWEAEENSYTPVPE